MTSYYYTRGAKAAGKPRIYNSSTPTSIGGQDSHESVSELPLERILTASRIHHRATGGGITGSSGEGLAGSITANGIHDIFQKANITGKHVLDLGAGDGRVLFQALAYGSASATGVELPVNAGTQQYIVSATAERMSRVFQQVNFQRQLLYIPKDIMSMHEIPHGVDYVYSFWVGFPIHVKQYILQLIAHSRVRRFTVYRQAGHFNKPEELLKQMEIFGVHAVFDREHKVHMHGSGSDMTAWTFSIPRWTLSIPRR